MKKYLKDFICGLEKESLRINSDGSLSCERHPKRLGSKLTHPYITTDFAEMQIEFATSTFTSHKAALKHLEQLHAYTNERMWPLSMPPKIPNDCNCIIADYGSSNTGRKKSEYRRQLCKRYGSQMQMISGSHYNFSFGELFWKEHKKDRSETYLHIIRNVLRNSWILSYLFGASPRSEECDEFSETATSLRLSSKGYHSTLQNAFAFNYDSLETYLESMEVALRSPVDEYSHLENHALLQIENEHYSIIRPKAIIDFEKSVHQAMLGKGIEYIELRALDLDPSEPCGVNLKTLDFIHEFYIKCLEMPSPPLHGTEHLENLELVALYGRTPDLKLKRNGKSISLKEWAYELVGNGPMLKLVDDPSLLPSSQTFDPLLLADEHLKKLKSIEYPASYETLAEQSHQDQADLELYETLEESTQVVIFEAKKQNITIDILDANDNIISLKKGSNVKYLKQATKSSLDSYISPLLMENKMVSKRLLSEDGLNVPKGGHYTLIESAIFEYNKYKNHKLAVKPNDTNFGVGISFVEPNSPKQYASAVHEAFAHSKSILVEEFFKGAEHRFLVLNGVVEGIVERDPAHVIGTGKHTIESLFPLLGEHELEHLLVQKLEPSTVLPRGKKVYLRTNSNVSTGRIAIDRFGELDSRYNEIAVRAAKTVDAKICGVDMIINESGDYVIVELNFNPVLYFHQWPDLGPGQNVGKAILNRLGF